MGHLVTKKLPKKYMPKTTKKKKTKVKKVKIEDPVKPVKPVKRGRGRPKGSKNATKEVKAVKEVKELKEVKDKVDGIKKGKGRGRPKGSRNRRDAQNRKKLTSKQLRDKKKLDLRCVLVGQFLGYCPECKQMISSKDMVSMRMVFCKGCEQKQFISKLESEAHKKLQEEMSEKEYLETGINVDYHDMPENEPDIPIRPEDIASP